MSARSGRYRIEPGADRLEWSYDPTTDERIMIVKGDHEISRDRFAEPMKARSFQAAMVRAGFRRRGDPKPGRLHGADASAIGETGRRSGAGLQHRPQGSLYEGWANSDRLYANPSVKRGSRVKLPILMASFREVPGIRELSTDLVRICPARFFTLLSALEWRPRGRRRKVLFELRSFNIAAGGDESHEVAPSGDRFIFVQEGARGATEVRVVLHWLDELRRVIPVAGEKCREKTFPAGPPLRFLGCAHGSFANGSTNSSR